jgi:hypothetical protein
MLFMYLKCCHQFRYVFGSIAAGSFVKTVGKHISLSDTNQLPATGTATNTAFLLKSNKQGVPQWAAHITGGSPASLQSSQLLF